LLPAASPLTLKSDCAIRGYRFADVRGVQPEASLNFRQGNLPAALEQLDALAEGARFLLGHNLIAFDLPHLTATKPELRLLKLPVVDTLWLNAQCEFLEMLVPELVFAPVRHTGESRCPVP
jgi:hypothetical protein